MFSLILIILAAICSSIMDTIANRAHFEKSIFSKLNQKYWLKTISWYNKYKGRDPKKGYRFKFPFAWVSNFLDGWHLFKMIMILLITASLAISMGWFGFWIDWLILGFAWNIPFNTMYNKILIKKSYRNG